MDGTDAENANGLSIPAQYVAGVLDGTIPAGKWVRLACERHQRDLQDGHERGLRYDEQRGLMFVGFIENFIHHSKGSFANSQFKLLPWQQFLVCMLFGWLNEDGTRRFTNSFIEVARKNGKTTLMAAVAILFFVPDAEAGAEIYFAAVKKDQANLCFREFRNMVKNSPALRTAVEILKTEVTFPGNDSRALALASDSNSLDGLNAHFAGIDEYHAHKTDLVFDVLESSMGARRQPHQMVITTAGFNRHGPCFKMEQVCKRVLEGVLDDDALFPLIFQLDEGDDWHDESTWVKANPSIGVTVGMDYYRKRYRQAVNAGGTKVVNFRTKYLNEWVDTEEVWIPDEKWMRGDQATLDLLGAECYGGLDLAATRDITALVLAFPNGHGGYNTKRFYWVPEGMIAERLERGDGKYRDWMDAGLLRVTPGDVTDYDTILRDIAGVYTEGNEIKYDEDCICSLYDLRTIAYDRYNSSQLVIDLDKEGVTMRPFSQSLSNMSAPTKELERLVLEAKVNHEACPVLRWMASNVVIMRDSNLNIKIDKAKAQDKVDGMVALVMAIGEAMSYEPSQKIITEAKVTLLQ